MSASDVVRVFIAIELPSDVREELSQVANRLRARCSVGQLKWVAVNSIHLTLKFLGEIPVSRLEAVRDAAAASCAGVGDLALEMGGIGAFPGSSRPRVIWVGLEGDVPRLVSLAERLDRGLQVLGFERESRPFSPHLTVARVRPDASLQTQTDIGSAVTRVRPPERLRFTATEVSLMQSQLRPEGPLYTCLARWALSS
ncbi:MAG: RNA 2',3'-cyclic phosphodiesterase [Dehalococcoidia bacterium]|jgi:2'-5' RNA ligase|nr:RNA 2',3'-cyclic phosphodiesterase [Dehalococcoidia bacterium]